MPARTTALSALIACRKQNAWSDGILKDYIARDGLDRRDAALASRLCYGVLQNRLLLDFYIASFLHGKLRDLQPVVLDILRLGVYQLTMTDRIPASAAVNEAVEQGKKYAGKQASGLINGVLRAVSRAEKLPEPKDLATKYSHSPELVSLLRENVGENLLEPLLNSHNEAPETALQVNPLRCTAQQAMDALEAIGASPRLHPWMSGCILVSGTGNLEQTELFRSGMVYAQDPAAKLAVLAAAPQPGMDVLDCCAAPGGKSFASALAMRNCGSILSCDLHAGKLKLIESGASRLGISVIRTMERDARETVPEWENRFDLVLADVPCSGLGVIRKKPEIRYKDLGALEALPSLQLAILESVCRCVKPGGTLLYSTCTILRRENEAVAERFLALHPEFSAEGFSLPDGSDAPDGMRTLLPCTDGTDGFFICKLRKHS